MAMAAVNHSVARVTAILLVLIAVTHSVSHVDTKLILLITAHV